MLERPHSPSSANVGASAATPPHIAAGRFVALSVGVLVVLIGFASVLSSAAHVVLGTQANLFAFAPVALLPQVHETTTPSAAPATALFAEGSSTTTPIVPVRLSVPSLCINAPVETVGKKQDGSMATPSVFGDVAWYSLGSRPGDPGTAVFAGHVNNALTKAGVFEHLSQITIGNTVLVTDASGRVLTYVVDEIDAYQTDHAPTARIFQTAGPSTLVLITCDGQWDAAAHSFDKRFVAYAHLVVSR